jgi:hypothetical protein
VIKLKNILTEGRPIPMDTPNELAYIDFKKWAYKNRSKIQKQMQSLNSNGGKMFVAMAGVWYTWSKLESKEFSKIKNYTKFGRALVVMLIKDDLIFDKKAWKKDNKLSHLK